MQQLSKERIDVCCGNSNNLITERWELPTLPKSIAGLVTLGSIPNSAGTMVLSTGDGRDD